MKFTSIPIILLKNSLIVSIQVELSDHLVIELKENISQKISQCSPHSLVMEISGVDIVDSYIARSIRDIAQVARLMGVTTIVAGLDAGMAITLVEMGMSMEGVRTALNLDTALQMIENEIQNNSFNQEAIVAELLEEKTGSDDDFIFDF